MATAEEENVVPISTKYLECVICISLYTEPVTLSCGHNFCRSCIQTHWTPPQKLYKCPMCGAARKTLPSLNKNIELAALVEKVRAQRPSSVPPAPAAAPPCCSGPEAPMLCLTCMRSYCSAHGLSHVQEEVLQTHLLVKSIRASWPCRDHAQALQYFCPTHGFPVCPQCVGQHLDCPPVTLLVEFQQRRDHMKMKLDEVSLEIERKEGAISRRIEESSKMNNYMSEIKALLTESFQDMKKYIEEWERTTLRKIEEERHRGEQELEAIINTLTVELAKLKHVRDKRQHLLEDDWLELLKGQMQEEESCVISPSQTENLVFDSEEVKAVVHAVETLKQSLLEKSVLEKSPLQEKQGKFISYVQEPLALLPGEHIPSLSLEAPKNPALKGLKLLQFSQYAAHVTFDPETIHCFHSLSAEKKKVTVVDVKQLYPKTLRRFNISQVLCSPGFSSGRHYWEVITKDCEGWAVGVAEERIGRRDRLGRNDFSWCVEWSNKKLLAWHERCDTVVSQTKPLVVGVLLDCERKTLSFYSADDETQLHTFESNFQWPVFPAVWMNGLGNGEYLTIM